VNTRRVHHRSPLSFELNMMKERTIENPRTHPHCNAVVWQIKHVLTRMAFNDIIRASKGGSKMGAFILASCFIDYLAGFRYGKETTRKDYIAFVSGYFDKKLYDPEKLYTALRCKLVHQYSEGGAYTFTFNRPDLHNTSDEDGKKILNLEQFVRDVESSMDRYFAQLEQDYALQELAEKRYHQSGLLDVYFYGTPKRK